jgi:putative tricarboxylic transport membrane protein
MMQDNREHAVQPFDGRVFASKDVLAGFMFIAVALFGLWASRNYPIGTTLRMSTGYVPRLLCWILLGLGVVIFAQGLRARDLRAAFAGMLDWRAILAPISILVFFLATRWFDVLIGTALMVAIGLLAGRAVRPLLFVPASLLVFADALESHGVVIAALLLIGVGSLAGREIRPLEVVGAAIVLVFLTLAIFIWGLGRPIPVWSGR